MSFNDVDEQGRAVRGDKNGKGLTMRNGHR